MKENKNFIFIITEFLAGGTLTEWIQYRHQSYHEFSEYEEEAKAVMKSLLQGVEYIHEKGYIHRDLKPDNIMFTEPGECSSMKITDFGLSEKNNPFATIASSNCGTLTYIAPEMLKRRPYNNVALSH